MLCLSNNMKNLLKYLILGIVALAFYHGVQGDSSVIEKNSYLDIRHDFSAAGITSISTPESDFCIPRQVSSVNAPRLQNNGRRHETSHRHNVVFMKAGKTINAGVKYIVQKQSILVHSSLIRPSNRLLYIGRLII